MQGNLFVDAVGHANRPLCVLVAYCHYAVIYRRSPVGLPVPSILANWEGQLQLSVKMNRLLQELAWEAVVQHLP